MNCSKCDRPIQRGQASTSWWEERDGKQYYKVAHLACLSFVDLGYEPSVASAPTRADKVRE